jgi:hypothetical protein
MREKERSPCVQCDRASVPHHVRNWRCISKGCHISLSGVETVVNMSFQACSGHHATASTNKENKVFSLQLDL